LGFVVGGGFGVEVCLFMAVVMVVGEGVGGTRRSRRIDSD